MTDTSTQIRDEMLSALRDVLDWCLIPAGWEQVEAILGDQEEALDIGDMDQLIALTQALELAGPLRLTEVDHDAVPVPDQVSERVNHLIHRLAQPGSPGDADRDTGTSR